MSSIDSGGLRTIVPFRDSHQATLSNLVTNFLAGKLLSSTPASAGLWEVGNGKFVKLSNPTGKGRIGIGSFSGGIMVGLIMLMGLFNALAIFWLSSQVFKPRRNQNDQRPGMTDSLSIALISIVVLELWAAAFVLGTFSVMLLSPIPPNRLAFVTAGAFFPSILCAGVVAVMGHSFQYRVRASRRDPELFGEGEE